MTELPELIKNDSRIGLPARDQDGKKCTILRVHRFSDGAESFTVDYGKGHQCAGLSAQEITIQTPYQL